jgi:hypothetical protein
MMSPSDFREVIKVSIGLDGGKSFLNNARKDLGEALMKQIERECGGDKKLYLSRVTDLVMIELFGTMEQVVPIVPATIIKPQTPVKTPNPGQGNLFNE